MSNAISTPQRLASMVDYQDDSVVSRVLFRGPGGTMTLFAFADGQGLSEHTNSNDAIIQVLKGDVVVRIEDHRHRVEAGEILHLPATVPHALEGNGPFKMLLTLLNRSGPE